MASVIELDDMQNGYTSLIERVLSEGDEVSPRGMRTREVLGACIVLHNPSRSVPVGVGRKLNLKIGAAESAQLIAGLSDATMMTNISHNFASFVEHDRLYGAYGPRIHSQMTNVIRSLTIDRDTRQAGAVIWRPDDLAVGSKDVPCTIQLHFMVRGGKLNMTTTMRSNDCVWGITYDIWQFTALQHAVAWAIGRPVGTYTHNAFSLHVYVDRDMKIIEDLHPYDLTVHPPMPVESSRTSDINTDQSITRWAEVRKRMEAAVGTREWQPSYDMNKILMSSKWYVDALSSVKSEGKQCNACRYVLPSHYFYSEDKPRCKWCRRDVHYGLPVGTVSRMILAQGGMCAICDRELLCDFHVDHDHNTGVVRGLLCSQHNTGIGLFNDSSVNLRQAANYLSYDDDDTVSAWLTDYNFLYRTRHSS